MHKFKVSGSMKRRVNIIKIKEIVLFQWCCIVTFSTVNMLSGEMKLYGRHDYVSLDKNVNVEETKVLPAFHKRL